MTNEVSILQDIMCEHSLCDTQRETLQKVISEKIIGGYINISKQDAISYEKQCDNLMAKAMGKDCRVSSTLCRNLSVDFGEDCIVLASDFKTADWVKFQGNFSELTDYIERGCKCVEENKKLFEVLMWTYKHRDELKD